MVGRMGWTAAKTARTVTNTSAMLAVSLSIRWPHHVVPVEAEPCHPVDPTTEDVSQGCNNDDCGGCAHRSDLGRLPASAPRVRDRWGIGDDGLGGVGGVLKVRSRQCRTGSVLRFCLLNQLYRLIQPRIEGRDVPAGLLCVVRRGEGGSLSRRWRSTPEPG